MKSVLLAAALLLPLSMTAAIAQSAAPAAEQAAPATAAAPKPARAAKPKPKPVHHAAAAAAATTTPEVLDIIQILEIRQIDPTTYEIDARLQNGSPVSLRMNAFVMQGLGRRLGTFGK